MSLFIHPLVVPNLSFLFAGLEDILKKVISQTVCDLWLPYYEKKTLKYITGYTGVSVPNPKINTNDILNKELVRIHLFLDDQWQQECILSSLSTLFQCLFTLVFKTAPQLSPFCATSAAACDLSSNLIGQPVLSWSGEKIDTLDAKNRCFFMLPVIAPGVNGPIGIYYFNTKASLLRIFAFSVERPLGWVTMMT